MMPGDNYDFLLAPRQLTPDAYPIVERLLLGRPLPSLGAAPLQPSGACFVPQGEQPWYLTPAHSLSLRQQLHQTVTWPATLHDALEGTPPEAYVFLRPSGVLLRYALEGFYEEIDRGSARFRLPSRSKPKSPPISLIDVKNVRLGSDFEHEVQAMQTLLEGIGHVCLIDNFAELGESAYVSRAADILYEAGVSAVTAIRTILYENVPVRDVLNSRSDISRRHAGFFKRAGKLCAQLEYVVAED